MFERISSILVAGVATTALFVAAPVLSQATSEQPIAPSVSPQPLPSEPGGDVMEQPPSGQAAQPIEETEPDVDVVESQPTGGEDDLEIRGGFVVAQRETNIMGSDLMDASVTTTASESLGSVNDILMDGDGRTLAIIVGVGGFLGIGEKDVAIPVSSLQLVFDRERAPDGSTVPASGHVEEALSTGVGGEIAYILVDFTREQLEEAPGFERWRPEPMATGATPSGSVGGMGTEGGTGLGTPPAQPQGAPQPQ